MPPDTVYVGRPSRFGNPCLEGSPEQVVEDFKYYMGLDDDAPEHFGKALRERAIKELRGRNLACWCPLSQPCHADVLLELANRVQTGQTRND